MSRGGHFAAAVFEIRRDKKTLEELTHPVVHKTFHRRALACLSIGNAAVTMAELTMRSRLQRAALQVAWSHDCDMQVSQRCIDHGASRHHPLHARYLSMSAA